MESAVKTRDIWQDFTRFWAKMLDFRVISGKFVRFRLFSSDFEKIRAAFVILGDFV